MHGHITSHAQTQVKVNSFEGQLYSCPSFLLAAFLPVVLLVAAGSGLCALSH